MILQSITVQALGAISFFSQTFTEGLNLLSCRYDNELTYALCTILNSKACRALPLPRIGKDTHVEAALRLDGRRFFVTARPSHTQDALLLRAHDEHGEDVTEEYLALSSHCEEHDLANVFDGTDKHAPLRVLDYLNEEWELSPSSLARRTDGLSRIRAFRTHLRDYVRGASPERICEGKQYEIVLRRDGRYGVRCAVEGQAKVRLSASENKLFCYLCFLKSAEFWDSFEELRNLHIVRKPFLVRNFLEYVDLSVDVRELLVRTCALCEQVFLLADPHDPRGEDILAACKAKRRSAHPKSDF